MRKSLRNSYTLNELLPDSLENLWDQGLPVRKREIPVQDIDIPFYHEMLFKLIKMRHIDQNIAKWHRDTCHTILLSEHSPITVLRQTKEGLTARIVISPEGFPVEIEHQPENWITTSTALTFILPDYSIKWIKKKLQIDNSNLLFVGISRDLDELLTSYTKSIADLDEWKKFRKLSDFWKLDKTMPDPKPEKPLDKTEYHFDLVHLSDGLRIDIETTWAKKFIHIEDVPQLWYDSFDISTRIFKTTEYLDKQYDSRASTIIPSLLVPLTSLVIQEHRQEITPSVDFMVTL